MNKGNLFSLYRQARTLIRHGHFDMAIDMLRATSNQPSDDNWRYTDLLAALLLYRKQYRQCQSLLKVFLDRHPGEGRAARSLKLIESYYPTE